MITIITLYKKTLSFNLQTAVTLPDEIVEKLQKSRKANAGGFNLRQIVLGTFDQIIHTKGEADTKSLFAQTYRDIMDIEPIPNTNMPANFGHLAGGYDAQYYGYLVSVYLFSVLVPNALKISQSPPGSFINTINHLWTS